MLTFLFAKVLCLYQCNAKPFVYTGKPFRLNGRTGRRVISRNKRGRHRVHVFFFGNGQRLTYKSVVSWMKGRCRGFLLWQCRAVKLTAGGFSVQQRGLKIVDELLSSTYNSPFWSAGLFINAACFSISLVRRGWPGPPYRLQISCGERNRGIWTGNMSSVGHLQRLHKSKIPIRYPSWTVSLSLSLNFYFSPFIFCWKTTGVALNIPP